MLCWAYITWSLVATAVAISRDLPAAFSGWSSGLSASRDFGYGIGTALSPPLWWLIGLGVVSWWSGREGAGRRATITLGVLLLLNALGAIGEPVTFSLLREFDPLLAVVQVGMITLPLAGGWIAVRSALGGQPSSASDVPSSAAR
jgi:hypothetical protein